MNDVAAESAIRIFAQHDANFSGSLTLSEFSEALVEAPPERCVGDVAHCRSRASICVVTEWGSDVGVERE